MEVAWTLQYEVFYYVLFGMAILSRYLMSLCIVCLVGCNVANLVAPLGFPFSFVASPYMWPFVFGIIVAPTFRHITIPKPVAWVLLSLTLPLFIFGGHYAVLAFSVKASKCW